MILRLFFILFFIPSLLFAASPTFEGSATDTFSGTGEAITMPSGITAGDLLVALVNVDGLPTVSATGWTLLDSDSRGTTVTSAILYKTAAGSDTMTLTVSSTEPGTTIVLRISGADNASLEVPTAAQGKSTAANPPSLTHSGGSDDYLYVAFATVDRSSNVSAAPTGYSGLVSINSGSGASSSGGMAYKATTASTTEDPSAFTNSSNDWIAWTIGIAPSGGGTPTPTPTPVVTRLIMVQ